LLALVVANGRVRDVADGSRAERVAGIKGRRDARGLRG
jgi:hypothetical protein